MRSSDFTIDSQAINVRTAAELAAAVTSVNSAGGDTLANDAYVVAVKIRRA